MNSRIKFFAALSAVIAGASISYGAFAAWSEPTGAPPTANRERPINVSSDSQEKIGTLILSNANNLQLRALGGNGVLTIKVNTSMPSANSYALTLPTTQGTNGQVLINNGSGVLSWGTPDSAGIDNDWKYQGTPTVFTSIYSEKLTRIGSAGTMDKAANPGDLYVQNNLELDGVFYGNRGVFGSDTNNNNASSSGEFYVQNDLEVDGTIYGNLNGNVKIPGATAGAIPFGDASGSLVFNASKLFWNNSAERLGIGTNSTGLSKIYIKANSGEEGLHIQSAADYAPLVIESSASSSLFKVDQAGGVVINSSNPNALNIKKNSGTQVFNIDYDGVMTTGSVPYARIINFPISCASGTVVKGLKDGGYDCISPLDNLGGGTNGQTLRYDGSSGKWLADSFLSNYGNSVGINAVPGSNEYLRIGNNDLFIANKDNNGSVRIGANNNPGDAFKLIVGGNVGPSAQDTYDLGSASYRWRNIFANNINVTGELNLAIATGSVLFMNTNQKVAGNQNKFFWDNNNQYLGIGASSSTSTKALGNSTQTVATVEVNGELRLNNVTQRPFYGTGGVLKIGQTSIHNRYGSPIIGNSTFDYGYSDYYTNDPVKYANFMESPSVERNYSLFIGQNSGSNPVLVTSGSQPSIIGNVGLGYKSLMNIGLADAGQMTAYNTAIGIRTLQNAVNARENVAIGSYAMSNTSSNSDGNDGNIGIGFSALMNLGFGAEDNSFVNSKFNIALGHNSAMDVNSAVGSIFIGQDSAKGADILHEIIAIGKNSALNVIGDEGSIYMGYNSGMAEAAALITRRNNIAIGSRGTANSAEDVYFSLGSGEGDIFLGRNSGGANDGNNNIFIGNSSGASSLTASINSSFLLNSGKAKAISAVYDDIMDAERGSNQHNSLLAGRFYNAVTNPNGVPFVRINGTAYIHSNADGTFNPDPNTADEEGSLFVEKNIFSGKVFSGAYVTNDSTNMYHGKTSGICFYESATTQKKVFYVNGLMVCSQDAIPTANCAALTIASCCSAQGGCNP